MNFQLTFMDGIFGHFSKSWIEDSTVEVNTRFVLLSTSFRSNVSRLLPPRVPSMCSVLVHESEFDGYKFNTRI